MAARDPSRGVINTTADGRPYQRDLNNHVVPGATVKWRDIGIQLLDPTNGHVLDIIERDHPNNVEECCKRMFQKWLDKTPDASWNHVLAALRSPSVELNHLANQIEQKLPEKSKSALSSKCCEQHINKLSSLREVEVEFAKMVTKIKKALLRNHIAVAELIEQLCTISAVSSKKVPIFDDDAFDRIHSIDELWKAFRNSWNIYDYDLLITVIDLTECAEAQEILDNFLARIDPSSLEDVELVLNCKEHMEEGFIKPVLRIKVNIDKCTFAVKNEVKKVVCGSYNLEKYSLYFRGIKEGCIEFIYHISKAVMSYLLEFKVTASVMADFATNNIISLQINEAILSVPYASSKSSNLDKTFVWKAEEVGSTLAVTHNGVAVIIGNSYTRKDVLSPERRKLHTLSGSLRDADMMKKAFDYLGFSTIVKLNVSEDELMSFLYPLAHDPSLKSCKRFVFAFSGHGGDGFVCSEDEKKIEVHSIVEMLTPKTSSDLLVGVPRLFFFDTCRGENDDPARGEDEKWKHKIPSTGDMLVAFATTPGYKTFEEEKGGVWTSILTNKLVTSFNGIYDILTEVNRELIDKLRSAQMGSFQQPELIGRLNSIICLLKESGKPPMSLLPTQDTGLAATAKLPSPISSRPGIDNAVFKCAKSLLNEFCQSMKFSLPIYTSNSESGFTVTSVCIVIEGNTVKYSHQSSEVVSTKKLRKECEERAAENAYLALTELYGVGHTRPELQKSQSFQQTGQQFSEPSLQLSLEPELASKIGLAVIVSNDYTSNRAGLAPLHGAHKDADRMCTTFTTLGYEVDQHKNVTSEELTGIVNEIATVPRLTSCDCFVFVFCGYGSPVEDLNNTSGLLYDQEGNSISLADIIDTEVLISYKRPKFLFFSLCQNLILGSDWLSPIKFLNPDQFPIRDNVLIACSMLPYRQLQSGSLWVELLAEAIEKQDDCITFILNDVSNILKELYSSVPPFGVSEVVNMLTMSFSHLAGPYPASSQTTKQHHTTQSQTISLMAQAELQTNSCTTKLQEYCQKFELNDPSYKVLPTESGGFYSTVAVAGESYTGAIRLDEEEAKESAAVEFAVQLLCLSQTHPTMDELEEHVVPRVAPKWYGLGLVLLDPGCKYLLDNIEKQHEQDTQLTCEKMFNTWLQVCKIATWYQLIEATRCINLNEVADNIESLLLQGIVGSDSEAGIDGISMHNQPLRQLLMQLSVSSMSKIGVAVIVSNDYASTELRGTHKDAHRMLMAYSKLGYAVFHCKNMHYYELTNIIEHISALLPHISCKDLVFVFSGHAKPGKDLGYDEQDVSGQLYTQDGWILSLAEILDYLETYRCPKLLICQNAISEPEESIFLNPDHFSKYENFLVACSSLPVIELQSGSVWIQLLSDAIQKQCNNIMAIVNDVNSRVKELYSSTPLFAEPHFVAEPENFLPESDAVRSSSATSLQHHVMQPLWPDVSLDIPKMSQILKSPIIKLQQYCQKSQLDDPDFAVLPTQRGGGFYSTVTIAGESYTGAIRLDKEEAKESAAERVVQIILKC